MTLDFGTQPASLDRCNDADLNLHPSANSSMGGWEEADQHPGDVTSDPTDYE